MNDRMSGELAATYNRLPWSQGHSKNWAKTCHLVWILFSDHFHHLWHHSLCHLHGALQFIPVMGLPCLGLSTGLFIWFCAIIFSEIRTRPLTHYSVAVKDNHYPVGRVNVIENRRHRGVSWHRNRWGPAGPRRFQTKKHRGGFLLKPRSPRTTVSGR